MDYFKKYSPFVNLLLLFIVVNVVLRIVLLFHPFSLSSFGILEIVEIFGEEYAINIHNYFSTIYPGLGLAKYS